MPLGKNKAMEMGVPGRPLIGAGAIIIALVAAAGILADVWLVDHLRATIQEARQETVQNGAREQRGPLPREPSAPPDETSPQGQQRTTTADAVAMAAAVERSLAQAGGWLIAGKAVALIVAVLAAIALMRIVRRQVDQLSESRERNRAVVDNMVDGAIHIDGDGCLVALNRAAERMFDRSSQAVRGQPLSLLLTPDYRQQLETKIRLAAGRGEAEPPLNLALEVQGQRSNGTHFPLYLAISEVAMGRYPVFTAIARDLTETQRQIQELAETRDKAMAADRAKSQFLAVMSHEIRTPMNGVMGMLDLLRDGNLSEQQLEFIDTAEKSSNVLLGIINDILDLSKIEAGKVELQSVDFNIATTIEEVAALVASNARGKDLEVVCFVEGNMPKQVRGDPYRLRQVLTNLMGNAVKFTEQGEVVVHAELESAAGDGLQVKVFVRDTGIGIPLDVTGKLFQPFSQADASTTRRFGGTGLGLVISKRLVELMGGEIGVESTPGEGSTFWFTVRLVPAQSRAEEIPPDLLGTRVLIVDDNATNRMILERYLGYWGAEPSSRDSAPAALDALHQAADRGEPFQLAILDMQMPDLDGIELAQLIKGDATLAQTPLLMLSSMGYPGEEARRAGIIISLLKPVRQALLHEAVLKALGLQTQSTARSQHPFTPTRQFNARVLVAEDNPVNETVERLMMSRLGVETVVAADGRQAVEMASKDRAIDLILMDIHMPVVSGIEAARQIREHEKDNDLSPIPIIGMTASALASDREACKTVGMNDFLSKPLRRQALDHVLAQWLPRDRQKRPGQPPGSIAANDTSEQELT